MTDAQFATLIVFLAFLFGITLWTIDASIGRTIEEILDELRKNGKGQGAAEAVKYTVNCEECGEPFGEFSWPAKIADEDSTVVATYKCEKCGHENEVEVS